MVISFVTLRLSLWLCSLVVSPGVGVFVYEREKMWNKVPQPLLPCEAIMLEKPYFPSSTTFYCFFESSTKIIRNQIFPSNSQQYLFLKDERFFLFWLKTLRAGDFSLASLGMFEMKHKLRAQSPSLPVSHRDCSQPLKVALVAQSSFSIFGGAEVS